MSFNRKNRTYIMVSRLTFVIGLLMLSNLLLAQPTISSISPASGAVGATLTIDGTGFNATPSNNQVYVGNITATVNNASTTQLNVTIPAGISRDHITVRNGILTAHANQPFVLAFGGDGGVTSTSLAAKSDFNSLGAPWTVNSADFNNDGLLDLMVGYLDNAALSIYRNSSSSGDVNFSTKADYNLTGTVARVAKAGDFDGDGKLDMAIVNSLGTTVRVYRNITPSPDATIAFSSAGDFTIGSSQGSLAINDVNNDGKTDIITAGGSELTILLNTSTGTGSVSFAAAQGATTPSSSLGLNIADFDLDGDMDIVVASNNGGGISYYTNGTTAGSATMVLTETNITVTGAFFDVDAADLDNDGKLDLLLSKPLEDIVTIYRNTSTSGVSFGSNFNISTSDRPNGVHANDIDGDGNLDVVVTSGTLDRLTVFPNNYAGTWTATFIGSGVNFTTGDTPIYLNSGDFNADGKTDLAVANEASGTVSVFANQTPIAPTVSSFSPTKGAVGTTVTINGANFSTTAADNLVDFNGTTANVVSAIAETIEVEVPAGATSGPITVSVDGIATSSSEDFIVLDSLLAGYGFDDNFDDFTGHGFTATGSVNQTVNDRFDNTFSAFEFNADSLNFLELEGTTELASSGLTGSITLSAWIQPTAFPEGETTIISNYDGSNGFDFLLSNFQGGSNAIELKGEIFGSGTFTHGGFPQDGMWNHVAMVYDYESNVINLYLNGSLVATSTGSTTPDIWGSANPITIGYNEFHAYFPGYMDDVRIYDQALAFEQIQAIHNESGWPNDYRTQPAIFNHNSSGGVALSAEGSLGDSFRYSDVFQYNSQDSISFYFNNSLDPRWGDNNDDGFIDANGEVIPLSAGIYFNSINIRTNEYVASEITSVGLIGSALTGDDSGWGQDDVNFSDLGNGNYILNGVSLYAGELKFRANDQWLQGNWGDDDADGTLELGGANIVVADSGEYDITLDLISKVYTLEQRTGGLLGYYPFDGTNSTDFSGNGNNGVYVGNVYQSGDRKGSDASAIQFLNEHGYMEIAHNGDWDMRGAVSVAFWIRPNSFPSGDESWDNVFREDVFGEINVSQTGQVLYHWLPDGATDWQTRATVESVLDLNRWSHVAVTIDASNQLSIFVNGVHQGSDVITRHGGVGSFAYFGGTGDGAFSDNRLPDLGLDEARVYIDQVLTLEEINDIYTSERPGTADDIMLAFSFDEGSLVDESGNSFQAIGRDFQTIETTIPLGTDRHGTANSAYLFEDNGNFIDVYTNGAIDVFDNYTVNLWINPTSIPTDSETGDVIFDDNHGDRIIIRPTGAISYHYQQSDGNYPIIESADDIIKAGEWQMVTLTMDKNLNMKLFHNGVLVLSQTVDQNNDWYNYNIKIASNDLYEDTSNDVYDPRYYNGLIDDFSYYHRALLEDEVLELFLGDVLSERATDVVATVIGPHEVQLNWTDNAEDETYYIVKWYENGVLAGNSPNLDANTQSYRAEGLDTDITYEFVVGTGNDFGVASSANRPSATPLDLGGPAVTIEPALWTLDEAITLTVDLSKLYPPANLDAASKIYLHSGPVSRGNENSIGWTQAPGNVWGEDNGSGLMSNNGDGTWSITINDPRSYYGVDQSFDATQIGMVFRNADGTRIGYGPYQGTSGYNDIFVNAYDPTLAKRPAGKFAVLDQDNYMYIDGSFASNVAQWADLSTMTLEAWVNVTTLPTAGCDNVFARYASDPDSPAYGMMLCNNGTGYSMDFWITGTSGLNYVEIPISDGIVDSWNHYAYTFDGSVMKAYQNGAYINEFATSVVIPASVGVNEELGSLFNGNLDAVRIWNYAKPATAIRAEIENAIPTDGIGLNANWLMDESYESSGNNFTPDAIASNDLLIVGEVIPLFPDLDFSINDINSSNTGFQLYLGLSNAVSGTIFNNDLAEVVANGSIQNKVFLSSDDNLSSDDIELYSEDVSIDLDINTSTEFDYEFEIPSDLSVGTYYLIMSIDHLNSIPELDDNLNNIIAYELEVSDLPAIPEPTSLSSFNVTTSSFSVNWNRQANSQPDGANILSDWELSDDANYSNILEFGESISETSLDFSGYYYGTNYYFRVRASSETDARISDWVELVITTLNDTEAPVINSLAPATSKTEPTDVEVTIQASDDFDVAYIAFYKRGSVSSDFIRENVYDESGSFLTTISSSDFGSAGVEMYAIAYDYAGNASEEVYAFITREFPANTQGEVPESNIGKGIDEISYTIFAFPFETTSLSQVISAPQDIEQWVVYDWTGSTYNSYPSNLTYGKGYWILVNDESILPLTFPNASAAPITGPQGYEISLGSNWTLIGNPSTLGSLNWTEVIQHNVDRGILSSTSDVSQLYVYSSGYSTSNTLRAYEGAFVKSSAGSVTLEIPISAVSGARMEQELAAPRTYLKNEGGWEVVMEFSTLSGLKYGVSGFGVHPDASKAVDDYDMKTPVLFDKYLKVEFVENSLQEQQIARSIHASEYNDVWISEIYSHLPVGSVINVDFNGGPVLENNQQLVLFDPQTSSTMKIDENTQYSFSYTPGYVLKFIIGDESFVTQETKIEEIAVKELYPNPSSAVFYLDVLVPESKHQFNANIEVMDLAGRTVMTQEFTELKPGSNSLELDLRKHASKSGLYFFEIYLKEQNSNLPGNKITKKGYLISRE
jgi:hypothetical protein